MPPLPQATPPNARSSIIRVLVIDDSPVARQALKTILNREPDIVVTATASNPFEAVRKLRTEAPDVVTLDLEMPRMDGLTFLRRLMQQHPLPVVVCSSHAGCEAALKALDLGAVEVVAKPRLESEATFQQSRETILHAIRAAASARPRKVSEATPLPAPPPVEPKHIIDELLPPVTQAARATERTSPLIVVGSSTGGTEALRVLLTSMPANAPGIVVVQHMPEHFTRSFAERLDGLCQIRVREAAQTSRVEAGTALIARGGHHLTVRRDGQDYYVEPLEGPLINRHRPSVDVLFRSAALAAGHQVVGIIMTGMGDDGARGCADLRAVGAKVLAQDEATCVVFGMPAAAIKRGAADEVLPLDQLGPRALRLSLPMLRATRSPFSHTHSPFPP